MRDFLLIARREYINYVTRRGFLISLLLFPFWIGLAGVLPRFVEKVEPMRAITVIDRDGGYQGALTAAFDRLEARQTLLSLGKFAKAENADFAKLKAADPDIAAMLESPERETSFETYQAKGGFDPVFHTLTPYLQKNWREFTPPKPPFELIPPPEELTHSSDFAKTAALYFDGDRGIGKGLKLAAILVIPKGYGAGDAGPAQYWSDSPNEGEINLFVRDALSQALRAQRIAALAPDSPMLEQAGDIHADMEERDPAATAKPQAAERAIAQFLPFGFAFLLFLATFISANGLLMGVIEEKSTRMIEILLSCASPWSIMAGKLAGAIGASLTTILLWALGLYVVASVLSPQVAHAGLHQLALLLSAGNLALIILYFACGLLIYGALFLGIGSMAATVTDAQALLGPAMLIILLPNILVSLVLANPSGLFAKIVSWIPIYTPYFMLMRLSSHPGVVELWVTAILTVVTAIFVLLAMAKVFADNVLTTERPPALGTFLRRLISSRAR